MSFLLSHEPAAATLNTQSRKQRELAAREERLLDIAYDLVREKGLVALQMSHLAQAAEVAMGTLYSHFSSKEDLLLALAVRGAAHRLQQIERAVAWQERPRYRMLAVTMADWLFIDEHPHLAQIDQYAITEVVWERASEQRRDEFARSREPIGEAIFRVVEDARAEGDLPTDGFAVEEVPFGLWTMLIGTHQLTHAAGLLEYFDIDKPYQLMVRHLNTWLNGLQWQPLTSPDDHTTLDLMCSRLRTEVFDQEC